MLRYVGNGFLEDPIDGDPRCLIDWSQVGREVQSYPRFGVASYPFAHQIGHGFAETGIIQHLGAQSFHQSVRPVVDLKRRILDSNGVVADSIDVRSAGSPNGLGVNSDRDEGLAQLVVQLAGQLCSLSLLEGYQLLA